jgi:hypothetical protein
MLPDHATACEMVYAASLAAISSPTPMTAILADLCAPHDPFDIIAIANRQLAVESA